MPTTQTQKWFWWPDAARKLRMLLLGLWCVWLTKSAIWSLHPAAYENWRADSAKFTLLLISGPLLVCAVSAGALLLRHPAVRLLRRLLLAHFLLGLAVGIASIASNRSVIIAIPFILSAMIDLPFIILIPKARAAHDANRRAPLTILVPIIGTAFVLYAWSALNPMIVKWRALSIADSDPFCLQVPADGSGRYGEAQSWRQLSGLRMQVPFTNFGGSDSFQFAFHAVLIVHRNGEDEFFNWSYYSQNFLPLTEKAAASLYLRVKCEPRYRFFENIT